MTLNNLFAPLLRAVDSDYFPEGEAAVRSKPEKFEFSRSVPFIILHLGCLGVIWTGWSWGSTCYGPSYHSYVTNSSYSCPQSKCAS